VKRGPLPAFDLRTAAREPPTHSDESFCRTGIVRALSPHIGALRFRVPADGLTERDGEQTGAQQHQAARGQRKKSVGHQVMVSHHTPAAPDARPNPINVSESAYFERAAAWLRRGSGPRA
jgi:hypothetical protein